MYVKSDNMVEHRIKLVAESEISDIIHSEEFIIDEEQYDRFSNYLQHNAMRIG